MNEHGWNLQNILQARRLLLNEQACLNRLSRIKENPWMVQGWSTSSISTSFWGIGTANLEFGNCNKEGEVSVIIDGTEIAKSKPHGAKTNAKFDVQEGTNLTIKTDNKAIIRLIQLELECGKSSISRENKKLY